MAEAVVDQGTLSSGHVSHTFHNINISGQAVLGNVYNNIYQPSDQFRQITSWLSPPDPWTNHESARQQHEPGTGTWLLQSDQYQKWKTGPKKCFWLYGKPGCGKTVLCSSVVQDVQDYCATITNSAYAVFYFSFSDDQKQSYNSLLRSLVIQLGWKEPGLSILMQAHEKPSRRVPSTEELETILHSCIESFDKVFVLLDALDECLVHSEALQNVLDGLERLSQRASNLRIFTTSREVSDVRDSMETIGADIIPIPARSVDTDIQKWISSQLSRDRRLTRLDPATKTLVEETISRRSDGMFRWAYCQLQELKKLKAFRPSFMKNALHNLPATLDDTYTRMLTSIDEMYHQDALTLLQWLAYARSPPSLGELMDAVIIDLTEDNVATDDRGNVEGPLNILSGLVTTISIDGREDVSLNKNYVSQATSDDEDIDDVTYVVHDDQRIGMSTKVKLAHFSVKEYLESTRILGSNAKNFHLNSADAHRSLAQSCLTYIIHYSSAIKSAFTWEDCETFPLLKYAAQSWFEHSLLQSGSICREKVLLSSKRVLYDWLAVYDPDYNPGSFRDLTNVGPGLYYAALLGLPNVVRELIDFGADVNEQGGQYGNPLQAASQNGHQSTVRTLLDKGADVNLQGGRLGNALYAASCKGHLIVAEQLLEKGAFVDACGGFYGRALQAASRGGYREVVKLLIDKGAEVNAQAEPLGNALQAASCSGFPYLRHHLHGHGYAGSESECKEVVKVLLDSGADVNASGGEHGNALQAALFKGYKEMLELLIDKGATFETHGPHSYDGILLAALANGNTPVARVLFSLSRKPTVQGDCHSGAVQAEQTEVQNEKRKLPSSFDLDARVSDYGNALQVASRDGNAGMVMLLLENGADINASVGNNGTALCVALEKHQIGIAKLLLSKGADGDIQGGLHGNALQAASTMRATEIVELLLQQGVEVNAQGGQYGNALQAASLTQSEKVIEMLISAGAEVNAQGGYYGTALQAASCRQGNKKIVEILLDAGAEVNTQGGNFGNALQAACAGGSLDIIEILLERGADINAQGGHYGNALQAAVVAASVGSSLDIIETLLERGADINAQGGYNGNALLAASARDSFDVIEILLERGADINARTGCFESVLEKASTKDSVKVVAMLLERATDINALGDQLGKALLAASDAGAWNVVETLLEREGDTIALEDHFGNMLRAACSGGSMKAVETLLERGVGVNAYEGCVQDAISSAAVEGREQLLEKIIICAQNINPTYRDVLGRSQIHLSASYGLFDVLQNAVTSGRDIDEVDNHGWTSMHWAAYFGKVKIVSWLLQHGAEHDCRDWQGWMPIQVATFTGYEEVTDIIIHANEQAYDLPRPGQFLRAFCDSCGNRILDIQHHCTLCPRKPGYDLCFRCIRDVESVHPNHEFTTTFRYG